MGTATGPLAPIEDITSALEAIPILVGIWPRIGMANWSATEGSDEGFTAIDGWSSGNACYSGDATEVRWDAISRSPPDSIGVGALFHRKRRRGDTANVGSSAFSDRPVTQLWAGSRASLRIPTIAAIDSD